MELVGRRATAQCRANSLKLESRDDDKQKKGDDRMTYLFMYGIHTSDVVASDLGVAGNRSTRRGEEVVGMQARGSDGVSAVDRRPALAEVQIAYGRTRDKQGLGNNTRKRR